MLWARTQGEPVAVRPDLTCGLRVQSMRRRQYPVVSRGIAGRHNRQGRLGEAPAAGPDGRICRPQRLAAMIGGVWRLVVHPRAPIDVPLSKG